VYDLLISGGEVLDPGSQRAGRMDVAVTGQRIAAVAPDLPRSSARDVVDATGQLVTPGLVDLHTHIYAGATFWGIRPDPLASRSGVTTWVDAGSAGAMNLPGLEEFIARPARSRIFAFLNISSIGLVAETYELANIAYCDVDVCVHLARRYPDLIRGIKVRMGTPTVGDNGLEPMHRASAASQTLGLPLMVHIGYGPPGIDAVLDLMRPGDILTHALTGATMRIVDEDNRLREAARRAFDRGVLIDLGHGAGGFAFEVAEAVLDAGYRPHFISSDAHQLSVRGAMRDLPNCLGKMMALGMTLSEVIEAATSRPAAAIGQAGRLGTLRPGAMADLALFRLEEERTVYHDTRGAQREGTQRLVHVRTIVGGEPLAHLPEEPPAPWMEVRR
jgi:dihydroorotase